MHISAGRRVAPALSAIIISAGMCLGFHPVAQAASVGVIDTTDKVAVAKAYLETYVPTLSVTAGWNGSPDTCDAGSPSAAGKDAIITAFNYMRAMAGLPSVTENAAESANTQQAALMMLANRQLSHDRTSDWKCYTKAGAIVGWEIIASGYSTSAIAGYMQDWGPGNEPLGHRSAVLASFARQIGVGTTGYYTAIHLVHQTLANQGGSYSWPPKGYFPYELVKSTAARWSYYPSSGNASAARVAVTKNGVALSIAKSYPAWNAADNYLSATGLGWDMPQFVEPAAGATDTYRVTITGITGGASSSVTYDVLVFSASSQVVVGTVSISGKLQVGSTLTASVKSVIPVDATLSYSWYRDGAEIGRGSTYRITAADIGKELVAKVVGSKPQLASGSSTAKINVVSLRMKQFTLSADMTGDKLGDVLAVDSKGDLWLYPGQAPGTLGQATLIGSGFGDYQVYGAGDLNGDGKGDVLAISKDGALWLFAGNGATRLGAKKQVGRGWTNGWRLVPAGDLNGDGKADLLGIAPDGYLYFYAGKGNGGFQPRVRVGSGWKTWSLYAAGDLNGDGKNDILGVNPQGVLYQYTGKGSGFFNPRTQAGTGWGTFTLASGADITGDKYADILGRNDRTGELYFYKGKGNGHFAPRVRIATGW